MKIHTLALVPLPPPKAKPRDELVKDPKPGDKMGDGVHNLWHFAQS